MVSFIGLGISRVVARVLTEQTMEKEMDPARALDWLRKQDFQTILGSRTMRSEVERTLANALDSPLSSRPLTGQARARPGARQALKEKRSHVSSVRTPLKH
jgi:hypothetical protein